MAELQHQIGERAQAAAGSTVREQPAPIPIDVEDIRHRFVEGPPGVDRCQQEFLRLDGQLYCSYPRSAGIHEVYPAEAVREQPAEAVPRQADEPALLDLVRQYGAERQRMGSASITGSAPAVHEHKTRAAALLARIEAEVKQLRGGLDGYGRVLDEIASALGHDGPIVPDLVAEVRNLLDRHSRAQRDLTRALQARGEFLDEANRLRVQRDEARAEVADYAARLKATDASWTEVARQRDEAAAEVERLRAELATEVCAHRAAQLAATTQSDPMVLRLPSVSKDATLIGENTGYRWTWHEGGWCSPQRGPVSLGRLLAVEGAVRVELAPPREPRTWPKLDEEYADLPSAVSVERHGTWRRLALPDDYLYQQADGGFGAIKVGLRLQLSGLRLLGEVTEVLNDEPGGDR